MTETLPTEVEPNDTYTNTNGKTVYVYVVDADSLRSALDLIPGDFKVYFWNQDRKTFTIEIVRTF